jgi:DNA helicase IV
MQWRMLGRRGRYSSWTIVGDPAQSSWQLPAEAAEARKEALAGKDQHAFRLSTNYRNSAEVFELAARVAQVAVRDPDLPDAVRRTGFDPVHLVRADLEAAVAEAVAEVAGSVEGTVAVVAPAGRREAVESALTGVTAADPRVRVLEPLDTKGLEFDGVVVVEPDDVVAESEAGWRTLYVVLTRATQRVVTVGRTDAWREQVDARR